MDTPHTTPAKTFLTANWLLKDSLVHNEYLAAKLWIDKCIESIESLQTESAYQDYLMR